MHTTENPTKKLGIRQLINAMKYVAGYLKVN
jgi:hypothetical protein